MFSVIPSDFAKLIRTDHLSAWAQVISADWMKKTYLSLPDNKERDEQIYPLTWKESHILCENKLKAVILLKIL